MKTFPTIAFAFAFTASLLAEPPAQLDGFAGIPFGSTVEQAKAAMETKDAHFKPAQCTKVHLQFADGKFGSTAAAWWHLRFFEGKFYQGTVKMRLAKRNDLSKFTNVKKAIEAKYGKPTYETALRVEPAELLQWVRSGKATPESTWRIGSNHSISCQLIHAWRDVIIRVNYQDDSIAAKVTDTEKDDI